MLEDMTIGSTAIRMTFFCFHTHLIIDVVVVVVVMTITITIGGDSQMIVSGARFSTGVTR
jgi:hypothetical protein